MDWSVVRHTSPWRGVAGGRGGREAIGSGSEVEMERRVEPRERDLEEPGSSWGRRSSPFASVRRPRRSRSRTGGEYKRSLVKRLPGLPEQEQRHVDGAARPGRGCARISASSAAEPSAERRADLPLRCAGSATNCGSIDSRGETTCCSRRRSPVRAIAIARRVTDAVGSGQPAAHLRLQRRGNGVRRATQRVHRPSASRAATRQRSHVLEMRLGAAELGAGERARDPAGEEARRQALRRWEAGRAPAPRGWRRPSSGVRRPPRAPSPACDSARQCSTCCRVVIAGRGELAIDELRAFRDQGQNVGDRHDGDSLFER